MEIKEGRKFISKYGNKVEVQGVHEAGIFYRSLEGNRLVNGVSTDEFRKIFKPITTHEVFRVWKFLEDDMLTSKQKATRILQGWPQELDGKTVEEMYLMFINLYVNKDWFVEEEVDECYLK